MKLICILILCSILLPSILAEREIGEAKNTKGIYSYLSHFCFTKGTRTVNITATAKISNGQKIAVLSQANFELLNKKTTCQEIEKTTTYTVEVGTNVQHIFDIPVQGIEWWSMIAYNCNPQIDLKYDVTWLNEEGFWTREFSYDDQGLGQLYITYTVFYFIALAVHIFGCVKLIAQKSYHDIVKMVTIAFSVELFATLLMSIHYGVYAKNGRGLFSFLFIGQILDLAGDLLMILLVILIAQGYGKNSMSFHKQKITFIILGVNLVVYVAMDIWKIAGLNNGSIHYLFDTAPGGIILTIRMLLFVYFIFAIYTTIREEQIQKKINFYTKFSAFVGVWFVVLPLFALIALGMQNYRRLVFISAIFVTMDFLGFVGLAALMWPTYIHDHFVVRQVESKIDFSEDEGANDDDF